MGMVLKAEHKRMERTVALKVMSKAAVESPDAVKRFHRVKAAATHRISSPPTMRAKPRHAFLVMEFVEGDDLSQLVRHGRCRSSRRSSA
jgi:serine/threonine protein kinase